MKRNINLWSGLDKTSILLFLMLVFIGWINIYAAVYNDEHREIFDFSQRYGKQFVWMIASIMIAFIILIIDSRFYFFFSWFIYAFAIILLLMVLVFGKVVYGARSWFELGGLGIQPSEFAKFATALALASYLNTKRQELQKIRVLVPALAIIFLPAILIALQPDMGSTVVFFAFFLVLFREGLSPYIFVSGLLAILLFFLTLLLTSLTTSIILVVIAFIVIGMSSRRWKMMGGGLLIFAAVSGIIFSISKYFLDAGTEMVILASVIVSGIFYSFYVHKKRVASFTLIYLFLIGSLLFVNSVDYGFNDLLQPHQKERIEIMLGKKTDLHGTGYNVNQSMISIGSGGLTGKGFLQGTQTKFKFVPKQSSDFIFCTVGEEWGFIGSIVVVGLFLTLIVRVLFLAERQRSGFSRIYGYGVASILFIHFFINIGMTIGLLPVIGIPLPFLSYGGSSLWGFTVLLFIFLRLDASRTEYLI